MLLSGGGEVRVDDNASPESIAWVHELVAGNSVVTDQFLKQYLPSLQRLAKSRMIPALRQRVGEDDIAQSVCRTFLRRASEQEFHLKGNASLWRLLCAITLAKVRHYARFHYQNKRGLDREDPVAQRELSGEPRQFAHPDPSPTPAELVEFTDAMEHLFRMLSEEEQQMVALRLDGYTQDEIANQLSCSARTVRRLLSRVQARWESVLTDSLGG
jgi:RNA polymerase sigma factor (sigma-70 family)